MRAAAKRLMRAGRLQPRKLRLWLFSAAEAKRVRGAMRAGRVR